MKKRKESAIFAELVKEALDSIKMNCVIPEDDMKLLLDLLTTIIRNDDQQIIPENYHLLSDVVSQYWRTNQYQNSVETEFIYQMGRLDTCIKLIDIFMIKETEKKESENLKRFMQSHFDFIETLYNNRGIRHKDLAAKTHKGNASALTQFVSSIQHYGIFRTMTIGREKLYYIMPKGEKLYQELCEEKRDREARLKEKKDRKSAQPARLENYMYKKLLSELINEDELDAKYYEKEIDTFPLPCNFFSSDSESYPEETMTIA